jgi:hypothetical protein
MGKKTKIVSAHKPHMRKMAGGMKRGGRKGRKK